MTGKDTDSTRSDRRSDRYANDPDYRLSARQRSREAYRAKHDPKLFDPRQNLSALDNFGNIRLTHMPQGDMQRWVFTKTEVAEVFGRVVKMFYRWVNDGRFPAPVVTAVDYPIRRDYKNKTDVKVPQTVDVYTVEEVRAAINALGPHLSQVAYYRKDHSRERRALYDAVRRARSSIGLPELAEGDA